MRKKESIPHRRSEWLATDFVAMLSHQALCGKIGWKNWVEKLALQCPNASLRNAADCGFVFCNGIPANLIPRNARSRFSPLLRFAEKGFGDKLNLRGSVAPRAAGGSKSQAFYYYFVT